VTSLTKWRDVHVIDISIGDDCLEILCLKTPAVLGKTLLRQYGPDRKVPWLDQFKLGESDRERREITQHYSKEEGAGVILQSMAVIFHTTKGFSIPESVEVMEAKVQYCRPACAVMGM